VNHISLKIQTGSIIEPRASVGKDVGYIIVTAPNQKELLKTLHFIDENITITVA